MGNERNLQETIINMEKAALERWGKGDPSGFLEISADDVCYFDPFTAMRIDGKEALCSLYESFRGQISAEGYELLNPKVQIAGSAAVLTFNYVSFTGKEESRWNCTEVYRCTRDKWEIIQTHWSLTQPFNKN